MDDNEIMNSSKKAIKSLKSTLQAAYNLVPLIIIFSVLIVIGLVFLIIKFGLLMAFSLIVIVIVSIVVYSKTKNYGEAALSLVLGMLTVFSVEWTQSKLIILATGWVGFSLIAIIISSIKIASRSEELYIHISSMMGYYSKYESKELEDLLPKEVKKADIPTFGPIEAAEIAKICIYKNINLDEIKFALEKIHILKNVIQVDSKIVAKFLLDLYNMYGNQFDESNILLDYIYNTFREVGIPPEEFIEYYNLSKKAVFRDDIEPDKYIERLKKGIELKIYKDEMYNFILDSD